ncbi:response regulator transcription factor [Pedobacter sp. Leaf176]|uniref:response regulator transcription factor n=1 Tax=Pedobacter sp. Leaf176 TaxID=1736286 RepID=UPI0009E9BBBC|nr:response regulator [Pedobacter sp. Leaf176]
MKKIITILEDDRDIREICIMLFSEEGYNVHSFENIASLSKAYPKDETDLFLLDIQLPDGNALDLCKILKASPIYQSIPILMMSANFKKGISVPPCQADGFIEKPFDINKLLDRVAMLMH